MLSALAHTHTHWTQDAYVQYLAQDANGALASFLEDARTTVLVVSVCVQECVCVCVLCAHDLTGVLGFCVVFFPAHFLSQLTLGFRALL